MNHATKVTGELVQCGDDTEGKPGAFFFLDSSSGQVDPALGFMCPCGCGSEACVTIGRGHKPEGNHTWLWDGNREQPTLDPSIKRVGGCKWHGYLKAGVWEPCGDSGQGA